MALSERAKNALRAALAHGPGTPEFDEIETILETAEALLGSIPTTDPEDGETIWNDNGVLKVASAGE